MTALATSNADLICVQSKFSNNETGTALHLHTILLQNRSLETRKLVIQGTRINFNRYNPRDELTRLGIVSQLNRGRSRLQRTHIKALRYTFYPSICRHGNPSRSKQPLKSNEQYILIAIIVTHAQHPRLTVLHPHHTLC